MASIREIQARLAEVGFKPGPIDGSMGRSTIAALKQFQKTRGLPADGIPGERTLGALFPAPAKSAVSPTIIAPVLAIPPWYSEGQSKKGLTEGAKKTSLMRWLRSDGDTLGDPAKLPWCGDFVQTCLALTLPDETLPANPYFATNWSKFGISISRPALGAVLVFSRTGGGHVGFYAGEDGSYYSVLGGNQSNSISIARVAKNRCIAIRWPKSYPLPKGGAVASSAGRVSTNEA